MSLPCPRALATLGALILLGVAAPRAAAAAPPEAQAPAAWADHPDAEAVARLAEAFDVHLERGERDLWRPGEARDFLIGLESVPSIMRPDEPIVVRRSATSCHYGTGRYNDTCPTFAQDERGRRVFLVYHIPPIHGQGAIRRFKALTQPERARLLRRRAAIHMAVALFDQRQQWSLRRPWRLINSWNRRGDDAFNLDVWAYSRYLGQRSAHLDLVTFAEEFFARPEDILRDEGTRSAAERLASYDWDLTLACQHFTKIRVLSRFVTTRDPTWTPRPRGQLDRGPRQQCPQFEMWADLNHVEGIDLLLAAATSDRPESLYGHLFLTIRYSEDAPTRSRGFEPVYQYGAVTDTNVSKIDYFSKGLLGGFYAIPQPNTFRGIDRLFLQYEQRTLRRYALNLSPAQLRQVMERMWEAERHITYPYYFLSDNCASMLIDLLAPAVDDLELPTPIRLALMPTEVLDLFASIPNKERGPLLVKRAETHFSSREVAMDAVPRRRLALAALEDALEDAGAPGPARRALVELDAELDEREPARRRDAYQRLTTELGELLDAHGAKDEALVRLAIDYLYYSSRIERYFMDLAFYQRRIIQAQALKNPPTYTAEEQLQMRRELFLVEDLKARQEAMMALARVGDERLRTGERRPFTEEERERLAQIEVIQAAYLSSLDALASTIERFDSDLDGVAYVDDKIAAFERVQRRRDALSMGPPGKGRWIVGASGGLVGDGLLPEQGASGWLDFSASLIHERLGEQRRRGFRSDIASRALGLDGQLRLGPEPLDDLQLDLTLFEFLSIEQRLGPVRRSWRDIFGWGMKLNIEHDGRRGMAFGAHGEIGYNLPLWTSDHVANFLLLDARVALRSEWAREAPNPDVFGARLGLMGQLHLYGRYANVLRFEAATYQWGRLDARMQYHWSAMARLQTEHALAQLANQQLLIAKPFVALEANTLNYQAWDEDEPFSALRAGLRFELPF